MVDMPSNQTKPKPYYREIPYTDSMLQVDEEEDSSELKWTP